jgi:hypothetical protein
MFKFSNWCTTYWWVMYKKLDMTNNTSNNTSCRLSDMIDSDFRPAKKIDVRVYLTIKHSQIIIVKL